MLDANSIAERAVAIAGIVQLYAGNYQWRSPDDERGLEAELGFETTLAEAAQSALVLLQQGLTDTSWSLAWRLSLCDLLANMLATSVYGDQIASLEWHLEIARATYSSFSSCDSVASLEARNGEVKVWLGFMRVMLHFQAKWLQTFLSPDLLGSLVHLTRLSLDDRGLFVPWLDFWKAAASSGSKLALSDTLRASLDKTLRRAFDASRRDNSLPLASSKPDHDHQHGSSLPPALLLRFSSLFVMCHRLTSLDCSANVSQNEVYELATL